MRHSLTRCMQQHAVRVRPAALPQQSASGRPSHGKQSTFFKLLLCFLTDRMPLPAHLYIHNIHICCCCYYYFCLGFHWNATHAIIALGFAAHSTTHLGPDMYIALPMCCGVCCLCCNTAFSFVFDFCFIFRSVTKLAATFIRLMHSAKRNCLPVLPYAHNNKFRLYYIQSSKITLL